jgi:hypothetical protein
LELIEFTSSQFEKVLAATQQPFPVLTYLRFLPRDETGPVVPDSFLGGSAPQLQTLILDRIPFPGLPKLLLSATNLVNLDLQSVPHSGYFSPEALVTALSVLTSLNCLAIAFESPRSFPDWKSQRPPQRTRTLLPALTELRFKGVSKYLEVLVARTDAPLLARLYMTFFHQLIFDTPHLAQFIRRTPMFKAHDEAYVFFQDRSVRVRTFDGALELRISCMTSDWQVSSLVQVCSSSLPRALISMMEHLYIQWEYWDVHWQADIENSLWLEFLHPFTAVKYLYISWNFTPSIAPALEELSGERVTEVLPALQSFPGGAGPFGRFETCPGKYWAVYFRTTARWSPHCSFSLGTIVV